MPKENSPQVTISVESTGRKLRMLMTKHILSRAFTVFSHLAISGKIRRRQRKYSRAMAVKVMNMDLANNVPRLRHQEKSAYNTKAAPRNKSQISAAGRKFVLKEVRKERKV